jgi:hypothetical protein
VKLIKCILILLLLSSCGPTLFSIGVLDITTGDVVVNGVKKKIYDKKKKDATNSTLESSN